MSRLEPLSVTFDFGQTLCELDTAMLARRLGERGLDVSEAALDLGVMPAWRAYDAAILAGLGGHPWKLLMDRLLDLAGVVEASRGPTVDWLWDEQPRNNLWRRPIDGMVEVVRDLRAAGVKLGVVSNSEGRLAELIAETPFAGMFSVVADSGRLGFEKPGTRIFQWTADGLGVKREDIVHVGDSYPADVKGALDAGLHALWFQPRMEADLPERGKKATNALEVRSALRSWGLLKD